MGLRDRTKRLEKNRTGPTEAVPGVRRSHPT
jgi:hypothetical protein